MIRLTEELSMDAPVMSLRQLRGPSPMRHQLLNDNDGQRMFAVVLQTGDEAKASFQNFIRAQKIAAAQMTGIGAFAEVDCHTDGRAAYEIGHEQSEPSAALGGGVCGLMQS